MPTYRRKLPRIEWGTRRTLFRYVAGEDLTLLGGVFSRVGTALYTDANGVIRTAASGVARDAHYVNGERTLLLEADAVNELVYSQDFTQASFWGRTNLTVTPGALRAPDGTMSASRIEVTANGAAVMIQASTAISTTVATYTIYARKGNAASGANRFLIWNIATGAEVAGCTINYDTGAVTTIAGSCRAEALTGENAGWYRIVMTATSGISLGHDLQVYVCFGGSVETAGTFAYVWQADLTPLPYATSPIPTTNVTVARNREDLYFPFTPAPQLLTAYARCVNLGIASVNSAWFYSFENGSGGNPRLIGLMNGAGIASAYYEHGSFVSSTPSATAPTYGQVFEQRTELYEDGSVVGGLAVNGGAEAVGARTSPASSGLAAAWSGQRVYLGSPAGARGPVAYTHFVVVAGTYGIARLRGVDAGDDVFDAVLSLGYPLDEAVSYPVPQDGGQMIFTPSGEADGWDAGTAHVLEGVVRWIPRETIATPVATGWDGASGWRAFLEWARRGNAFWFCPDASDLSTGWTVHLEAPFDEGPTLEPDMTRALRVRLRATVPIEGY